MIPRTWPGVLWAGLLTASLSAAEPPLVVLKGTDFVGGAREIFGSTYFGQTDVNYVYARSTGAPSTMRATFSIPRLPPGALFLFLTACDDDAPSPCEIEVALNGHVLFQGPSGFPNGAWATRRIPLPDGILRAGTHTLALTNRHETGPLGHPPWFMVARCAVAGRGYRPPELGLSGGLKVKLPARRRPLPEPLPPGQTQPGFRIRGLKGWGWTPDQYLQEIPILARYKMNFLMNCYLSMYSHPSEWRNEWWQPLPEEKKRAYAEVIRRCREYGLTFCFAKHPQLSSPRPLDPASDEDFEKLWPHFAWAQSQGVKWFCLPLDDVEARVEQFRCVNKLFQRLRAADPEAQLIFCPSIYWGDGTNQPYLEALAREVHPEVYVFWTGDGVVTPRITRRAAESYKRVVRHRLILWDNYPVNDNHPTLHLGPVTGRDADLCEVIDGYMSNPMCTQNQANRIPLLTCADYAYNPKAYDPMRSIGQAIVHLARTAAQRRVLADLVEAYPGMLIFGGGTATNPVRERFQRLMAEGRRGSAQRSLRRMEELLARLKQQFPNQYPATRKTLAADLAWMQNEFQKQFGGEGK
jgi:hypothetical protein